MVTVGLDLTGAHILMMLELCVLVGCTCIYSCLLDVHRNVCVMILAVPASSYSIMISVCFISWVSQTISWPPQ